MSDADEAVEVGVGCAVALGTGLRIVTVTIEAVAGAGVSLSGALDVARIHSPRYWSRQQRQNFESPVPCSTASKWRLRPRGWPPCACSVLLLCFNPFWTASCC